MVEQILDLNQDTGEKTIILQFLLNVSIKTLVLEFHLLLITHKVIVLNTTKECYVEIVKVVIQETPIINATSVQIQLKML